MKMKQDHSLAECFSCLHGKGMSQLRDIPKTRFSHAILVKVEMKEILAAMRFLSKTESDRRRRRNNVGSEPGLEVDQAEVVAPGRRKNLPEAQGRLQENEKRQGQGAAGQKENAAVPAINTNMG